MSLFHHGDGSIAPPSMLARSIAGSDGDGLGAPQEKEDEGKTGRDTLRVVRRSDVVFANHGDVVAAAAFMQEQHVVTASWDKMLRLWSVDRPAAPLRVMSGHTKALTSLDVHPLRGDIVVTASLDKSFRLWDVRARRSQMHAFQGHSKRVSSARFVPDDANLVVSGSDDRTCRVWDVRQPGVPFMTITAGAGANNFSIGRRTRALAAPLDTGVVALFDLRTGAKTEDVGLVHGRLATSAAWSDDETMLASVSFDLKRNLHVYLGDFADEE